MFRRWLIQIWHWFLIIWLSTDINSPTPKDTVTPPTCLHPSSLTSFDSLMLSEVNFCCVCQERRFIRMLLFESPPSSSLPSTLHTQINTWWELLLTGDRSHQKVFFPEWTNQSQAGNWRNRQREGGWRIDACLGSWQRGNHGSEATAGRPLEFTAQNYYRSQH